MRKINSGAVSRAKIHASSDILGYKSCLRLRFLRCKLGMIMTLQDLHKDEISYLEHPWHNVLAENHLAMEVSD